MESAHTLSPPTDLFFGRGGEDQLPAGLDRHLTHAQAAPVTHVESDRQLDNCQFLAVDTDTFGGHRVRGCATLRQTG